MKYGWIGLGNMGGAILAGMRHSGQFEEDTFLGYDANEAVLTRMSEKYRVQIATITEVAHAADVLLLGVKPQVLPEVLRTIAPIVSSDTLIVAIAAGKPIAYYESAFHDGVPVVRVMPNINARVGAAVAALCAGRAATEAHQATVEAMFAASGQVFRVPEALFSAFSAVGSASLAFTYMYIDALARAGVKQGMPRALALSVAAGSVLGSAKMLLESDTHPMQLADQVCSPGGTTIEGVMALRALGFENAVHQAVDAVVQKDQRLGQ